MQPCSDLAAGISPRLTSIAAQLSCFRCPSQGEGCLCWRGLPRIRAGRSGLPCFEPKQRIRFDSPHGAANADVWVAKRAAGRPNPNRGKPQRDAADQRRLPADNRPTRKRGRDRPVDTAREDGGQAARSERGKRFGRSGSRSMGSGSGASVEEAEDGLSRKGIARLDGSSIAGHFLSLLKQWVGVYQDRRVQMHSRSDRTCTLPSLPSIFMRNLPRSNCAQ